VTGGECKIKEPPPHVILGKTQVDQDWVDGEIEVGVTVCGFPRPGPRPATLDAPTTRQIAAAPAPVKRKGFVRRVKERLIRPASAAEAPAPLQPQPPIVPGPPVVAAPTPPAPPPPQDPVDALLRPRK
jgi:hypothetical protein